MPCPSLKRPAGRLPAPMSRSPWFPCAALLLVALLRASVCLWSAASRRWLAWAIGTSTIGSPAGRRPATACSRISREPRAGASPRAGRAPDAACNRAALSGELLWLAVAGVRRRQRHLGSRGRGRGGRLAARDAGGCRRAATGARRPRPDPRRPASSSARRLLDDQCGANRGGGGADRGRRASIPVRGTRARVHDRRGGPHPRRDRGRGAERLPACPGRDRDAVRRSPEEDSTEPGAKDSGGKLGTAPAIAVRSRVRGGDRRARTRERSRSPCRRSSGGT